MDVPGRRKKQPKTFKKHSGLTMQDNFGRQITKMRISVTDRCNLHCKYCMPHKVKWLPHKKILSLEEIAEVATVAATMGIDQIRLTGGEPLLRKNICKLIQALKKINGITEVAMTTNGVLLNKFAKKLFESGLDRINISLDTLDQKKFSEITKGGNIKKVLAGIDAAIDAGLHPIKLNCVIEQSSQEADAQAIKNYATERNIKARFIKLMNLKNGHFSGVEGGNSGNCEICNRIRLLCDGSIKPCLFSDIEFNVRKLGIKQALEMAAKHKPKMGGSCLERWMYEIGG
jgi:cyclic pyranopterin phosphate synthase